MKKQIVLLLIVLLFANQVSAFAVSSAYYPENPLKLYPGETANFKMVLQNPSGPENVNLKASIISGSEIIQITDLSDIYEVSPGDKVSVNLRAIIPADAKIGDVYPVDIEFITISENDAGKFGFGSAIGQDFNIVVAGIIKPKTNLTLYLIIGAVLVIILILIVVLKSRTLKDKFKY